MKKNVIMEHISAINQSLCFEPYIYTIIVIRYGVARNWMRDDVISLFALAYASVFSYTFNCCCFFFFIQFRFTLNSNASTVNKLKFLMIDSSWATFAKSVFRPILVCKYGNNRLKPNYGCDGNIFSWIKLSQIKRSRIVSSKYLNRIYSIQRNFFLKRVMMRSITRISISLAPWNCKWWPYATASIE